MFTQWTYGASSHACVDQLAPPVSDVVKIITATFTSQDLLPATKFRLGRH